MINERYKLPVNGSRAKTGDFTMRNSLRKRMMMERAAELIDGKYAGRLTTPDGRVITSADLSEPQTIQDIAAVVQQQMAEDKNL
jgi:hypothetical protein